MTTRENRLESQGHVDPGHRFERGERRRVALPPRTCANIASPTGIRALEESSDDGRYPPLQLLATFGLAAAMQRSGNSGRAAELRDRLRQVAPHCSPILGQPEQFAASAVRSGEEKERPVSSAVSSLDAVTGTAQERSAKRKIFKFVAITAGIWVALGVLFLVMQAVFSLPH